MDPNNQQFSQNNYDFITNPGQAPKQPLFGGSMKSRIIIVVGGAIFLIIALLVISSIMSSGQKSVTTNLKALVAEQEEIARIAKLGSDTSMSSSVRGFAVSTEYSVKTSQQAVIGLLQKNKVKLEDKELKTKTNQKTDKALEAASSSNRYDDVFMKTLTAMLEDYKKDLQTLYQTLDSEDAKKILNDSYASADTLIKKPSTQPVSAPAN